jgi:hypothetical protein
MCCREEETAKPIKMIQEIEEDEDLERGLDELDITLKNNHEDTQEQENWTPKFSTSFSDTSSGTHNI